MLRRQQACSPTSSAAQIRPMRGVTDHTRCLCQVGAHGLAVHGHGERCFEHPRSGCSVRWSEPDFAELPSPPQSYPVDTAHGYEDCRPIPKYPAQNINFPASGSRDIHTWVAHICEKGLRQSWKRLRSILALSTLTEGTRNRGDATQPCERDEPRAGYRIPASP